jgi:integrase
MGRTAEGFRVSYKRGWAYVRFTHTQTEHRIALGTRDPDEAKKRAAEEYAATLSGRRRPIVVAGHARRSLLSLDELLAEWIADQKGVLDDTTCDTLTTYGKHYVAFFTSLEQVTTESAKDYTRARLRKVTRSTVLKELTFLRSFLRWCVDHGVLGEGPVIPQPPRKATGMRAGPQRAKPVEVSEDEARRIIKALPELSKKIDGRSWPVRARYEVAYETSLRPATIALLSVPEHYTPGVAQLLIEDADDKARFGRPLPLSPAASAALDAVAPASGLIFGAHCFTKALKRAAAAVLDPERARRFAQYDFRHGRITHLLDVGAPLTGAAYLAGHRRVSTTDKYLRPSRRAAERALAAAIPAPFPPPAGAVASAPAPTALIFQGDRRGSNPRHLEPQSSALPAELRPPHAPERGGQVTRP